ncbi:MAG: MerC domain-containing protein [Saprospiraceae bacterium]
MSKFINNNIDFWGFLASFLCALHCAAIPLILLFGSLGSFAWLANHTVELGFITVSIILAYWSLWSSYKKHHKQKKAVNIVLIGFGFLIVSRLVPHDIGDVLVVIGGLIVAYAHYVNWQLLQVCKQGCNHHNSPKKVVEKKATRTKQMVELEEAY